MNAFGKVTKFLVAAFAVTACLTSYAIANESETDSVAVDSIVEGDQPDDTVNVNQPNTTVDGNQPDTNLEGNQPDATLYEYKHEVIEEPPYEGKIHVHLLSTIPSSKFLSREDRSINMEAVESRMEAIVERIVNHKPITKWQLLCNNIVSWFKIYNDLMHALESSINDTDLKEAVEISTNDTDLKEAVEISTNDTDLKEAVEISTNDTDLKEAVERSTSESDLIEAVEGSINDTDLKEAVEYSINDSDCKGIVACLKSARPIELPEDVAQDLGNLESGPLPKTLIQQLAESLAGDLMRRKFGRIPYAPNIIFQNPRSTWQKKYKNIKNYVIEALKYPTVLEV